MSDFLGHECGVAFLRFRKPFSYYVKKYGSLRYCIERLYLLMHKQHNRGQDGAGMVAVKIDHPPGQHYMHRRVSVDSAAIEAIFKPIFQHESLQSSQEEYKKEAIAFHAARIPWLGEVMLGHLRYGTYGNNSKESCHPFIRPNNWRVRNIALAGNFNMTNNAALFDVLRSLGQHPVSRSDTALVMEKIGHFLDEEVQRLYRYYKKKLSKEDISAHIEENLNLRTVLQRACKDFDGGYVLVALLGHGAAFVARDKAGIRPAYYYADEEVIVATSEKPPIKTAFGIPYEKIQPIPPAHALIIDSRGRYELVPYIRATMQRSCVFERIYFSRASDPEVYQERKRLGRLLAPSLLKLVKNKLPQSVFSYIPNTSEVAFIGLMEGVSCAQQKGSAPFFHPRIEKLISKDMKLRTFITSENERPSLVSNVYDTTYEIIRKEEDTLVIMDDSVVRGTTLQRSILMLLATLSPKEIIIVSSAPQIRYPDCYGIDMSRLQDFVAFQAAIALLKEQKEQQLIEKVATQCKAAAQETGPVPNFLREIYAPFSEEEISTKIAEIIRPQDFKPTLQLLYLPIKDLKKACPQHRGDWYFTGNYPTAGGNRIANRAFLQFTTGNRARAY